MPKEKEIELQSMSLMPPFEISPIHLSMYEFAEEINSTIRQALKILEKPEDGALSFENSKTGALYRMQKLAPNQYGLWDAVPNTIEVISAQEALGTLYAHMPYVDIAGTEMHMDILAELAKRKKSE